MLDTERWAAVLARDRESRFLYAVGSTGIYCRPSCPSRRPQRENVTFFDSPEEAERAGYRACRRCSPSSGQDPLAHLVTDVCRFLEANIDRRVTLTELAEFAGLSPFHLQRRFKAELGVSPREYAEAHRRQTMPDSKRTRETIRYGISESPLGPMLVAQSERGICAVSFDRDAAVLTAWLRQQFPNAVLENADVSEAAQALVGFMDGAPLGLPLDIRATAFQHKAWQALQAIPRGKTLTYEELAAAIGQPSAVRAAAHACATNRIAVAIPCHRVLRKDGSLGGYRWGIEKKRRLLDLER